MSRKLLESALIVAGTSVGATTLALPLTLSSGFLPSVLILILIWLLAYTSSLVNIDINKIYPNTICLSKLCKKVFSHKIFLIADISIIILFYSLICAYLSGIKCLIYNSLSFSANLEFALSAFLIFAATMIISAKSRMLYLSNKIIFLGKIIIFSTIIFLILFSNNNLHSNNYNIEIDSVKSLLLSIPIIFTAFGFHGCVPMIIKYLSFDHKKAKKAFFYGSFLSLIIYITWILVIYLTLPLKNSYSLGAIVKTKDPLAVFINTLPLFINFKYFIQLLELFGFLAIITSFFGVGASLFDYFHDRYFKNYSFNRLYISIFTFLPPLLIVLINQNIFKQALAFAAIFLSLIAIILPNLIFMKIKKPVDNYFKNIFLLFSGSMIIVFEILNIIN